MHYLSSIALALSALSLEAASLRTEKHPGGQITNARTSSMIRVPLKRREDVVHTPLSFMQTGIDTGPQLGGNSKSLSSSNSPPQVAVSGVIRIGTPPQEFDVAFDTGSSNLLMVSNDCRSVGCLAHKPFVASESSSSRPISLVDTGDAMMMAAGDTVSFAISTGIAEGKLDYDNVCLGPENFGNVCTDTGFVEMTRMSQEPFNKFPYDGIMGLGMPAASLDQRFNFVGNLAQAGIIERNRFAVWLAYDYDHTDSEITFGGFNASKLASEILWLPVSKLDTGMWQANMVDVMIQGHKQGICGQLGCQAVFDTGTAAIAGPVALIKGLVDNLNVQEDCSNYDSLPTLGFGFRMYILNIEKEDYVKKQGAQCFVQLLGIDLPEDKGPLFMLGSPFMTRYFTIFDRESLQIGVAFSNHVTRPGLNQTPAQRAPQLMVMVS